MGMKRYCWILCLLGFLPGSAAFGAVLSGTVVDEEARVVAGAQVWLWQEGGVQDATAGPEGKYSFSGVMQGPAQVVAYVEGKAIGGATRFVVGDAEETLVLGPAGTAVIRLLAEGSSAPIAGARIISLVVADTFIVPVEDLQAHGFPLLRSDDAGEIVVPCLPADGFAKMAFQHRDFSDTYVDFVPVREKATPVVMRRGAHFAGRVTDGKKPVAGARFNLFELGTGGQRAIAQGVTDSEGLYSGRALAGSYFLALRHSKFASPPPIAVEIGGEEVSFPDVALPTARYIDGSVLLPDDKPAQGIRVTYRLGDTIYDETYTDSGGKFGLKVASPKGILRVSPPPGYMTEILSDIRVDLEEQTKASLAPIKLRALPRIEGRVVLEDGSPGSEVIVASVNSPVGLWMLTDAEGRFSFQLLEDPTMESVEFLAEHAKRFQRATFSYSLAQPAKIEVTLGAYAPDESQPEENTGANPLAGILDMKAPAWECSTWFNGDAVSLAGMKGKVVALLFWAGFDETPEGINYIEQMRALQKLYEGDEQVAFVGIHDVTSEAAEVAQYIEARGITFPVGLDADPSKTFGAYHVNFLPEILLLDKSGNARYFHPGPRVVEFIKVLRRRPG